MVSSYHFSQKNARCILFFSNFSNFLSRILWIPCKPRRIKRLPQLPRTSAIRIHSYRETAASSVPTDAVGAAERTRYTPERAVDVRWFAGWCRGWQRRPAVRQRSSSGKPFVPAEAAIALPAGKRNFSGFIENTSCWLKKASRSRGTDWLFEKDDLRERITWQPDSPIQTLSNSCLRILPERCSEWFRATFHTGFRWTLPSRQSKQH